MERNELQLIVPLCTMKTPFLHQENRLKK